jgi:hypothetical protein
MGWYLRVVSTVIVEPEEPEGAGPVFQVTGDCWDRYVLADGLVSQTDAFPRAVPAEAGVAGGRTGSVAIRVAMAAREVRRHCRVVLLMVRLLAGMTAMHGGSRA